MNLSDLIPTQDYVRNPDQIPRMVDFIQADHSFTTESMYAFELGNPHGKPLKNPPIIQVERFPDGKHFIRDGHHRGVAIYLAGRDELRPEEYQLNEWTYQQYLDIEFLWPDGTWMGWVTPFDPKIEIRLEETRPFKKQVKDIYYKQSPQHAIHHIKNNKHLYAKPRNVHTVEQLASIYTEKSIPV